MIKIGTVDSRSAPVRICNQAYEGVAAFFADVNARGGINGYKFKLVGLDDATDANKHAAAVKRLVEQEKVSALVGMCSDLVNNGDGELTKASGTPVVGGAASNAVWYSNANFFPTASYQAYLYPRFSIEHAVKLGYRKIALLFANAPPSIDGLRKAKQYAQHHKLDVVYEAVFSLVEPDFTQYVVRMKDAGAEAVLFGSTSDHAIRLLRAMEQQRYDAKVYTPHTVVDPTVGTAIGPYAEGRLLSVLNYRPEKYAEPGGLSLFRSAMKTYFPRAPISPFTYDGWMAGEVFAEAVKRLGGSAPTSDNLLRALRSLKGWSGTFNFPITYGPEKNTYPTRCDWLVTFTAKGEILPAEEKEVCADGYDP